MCPIWKEKRRERKNCGLWGFSLMFSCNCGGSEWDWEMFWDRLKSHFSACGGGLQCTTELQCFSVISHWVACCCCFCCCSFTRCNVISNNISNFIIHLLIRFLAYLNHNCCFTDVIQCWSFSVNFCWSILLIRYCSGWKSKIVNKMWRRRRRKFVKGNRILVITMWINQIIPVFCSKTLPMAPWVTQPQAPWVLFCPQQECSTSLGHTKRERPLQLHQVTLEDHLWSTLRHLHWRATISHPTAVILQLQPQRAESK